MTQHFQQERRIARALSDRLAKQVSAMDGFLKHELNHSPTLYTYIAEYDSGLKIYHPKVAHDVREKILAVWKQMVDVFAVISTELATKSCAKVRRDHLRDVLELRKSAFSAMKLSDQIHRHTRVTKSTSEFEVFAIALAVLNAGGPNLLATHIRGSRLDGNISHLTKGEQVEFMAQSLTKLATGQDKEDEDGCLEYLHQIRGGLIKLVKQYDKHKNRVLSRIVQSCEQLTDLLEDGARQEQQS